eukprot:gene1408-32779_t
MWMERFLDVSSIQLRTSDSHSLSVMALSLSRMGPGCRPGEPWMQGFCQAFLKRCHLSSAQSLSTTLLALGRMGYCPGQDWLDRVANLLHQVKGKGNAGQPSPPNLQDLDHAAWALDVIGYKAPQLTVAAAQAQIMSVHQRLLQQHQAQQQHNSGHDPLNSFVREQRLLSRPKLPAKSLFGRIDTASLPDSADTVNDSVQNAADAAGPFCAGVAAPGAARMGSFAAGPRDSRGADRGAAASAGSLEPPDRGALAVDMAAAVVHQATAANAAKHVASTVLALSNMGCPLLQRAAPPSTRTPSPTSNPTRGLVTHRPVMASPEKGGMPLEEELIPLLDLCFSLLPVMSTQSVAVVATMLHKKRLNPGPKALQQFMETCYRRMSAMSGHEMYLMAACLPRMSVSPNAEWMDRFYSELFQRCQGVKGPVEHEHDKLKPKQCLAFLRLAGAARWPRMHPRLLEALVPGMKSLRDCRRVLNLDAHADIEAAPLHVDRPSLTAAHLAQVSWTLARLDVLPNQEWALAFLSACRVFMDTSRMSASSCAKLGWALSSLRVLPPIDWTLAWLSTAAASASSMKSRDLTQSLWAAARFIHPSGAYGHRRKRIIRPYLSHTKPHLAALSSRAEQLLLQGKLTGVNLLITMWALARLQIKLGKACQEVVLKECLHALPRAKTQLMVVSVWSLYRIGCAPSLTWISWLKRRVDSRIVEIERTSHMYMYFIMYTRLKRRYQRKLLKQGKQSMAKFFAPTSVPHRKLKIARKVKVPGEKENYDWR